MLKPEYLKDENSELVMNVSSKHVDIIKRYEDGTYLDLFVIESQSYVDPSMVARVMEYESIARMRYIRQNFKKHIPMHTRLPMILTVVLYVGESKWNAAKRLSELEIIHPGFEDMFNEFKLNLIELNTNHKYNTGKKATQDLFDLLRMIHTKQILKEDLDREFNRDALYFAYVVTKNKELLNIYQKSEKGDVKVCRALDVSMCTFKEPVSFLNGKKAKIIIVLCAEDKTKHIHVLNDMLNIFSKKKSTDQITSLSTPAEIYAYIDKHIEK